MRDRLLCVRMGIAVVLLLIASAALAQDSSYSFQFTRLHYPGSSRTDAFGINKDGTVVGSFSWDYGFIKPPAADFAQIYSPWSNSLHPYAVSDSGVIVGELIGNSFFRSSDGDTLGLFIFPNPAQPAGAYTVAYGVNAAGNVVGTYREKSYPNTTHSYLCTSGHLLDTNTSNDGHRNDAEILADQMDDRYVCDTYAAVEYPGAAWTVALGLNNNGDIVGYYRQPDPPARDRGFLYVWSENRYYPIDYPGNTGNTYARGVNNSGQIVGEYSALYSPTKRGFLKDGGTFVTFDYPDAVGTQPYGINDGGVIVGTYSDGNSNNGFLTTFTPHASGSIAHILAIKRTEGSAGNFVDFSFSLYGSTPQYYDYLILKSPSGAPLADSRVDYFSGGPGSGYELNRGGFTNVETGYYRVERWYQESCEVFTLPYEVKISDVPTETSRITYPTPTPGINSGPSVTFTWEAFPIHEDETILYYIEVHSEGFDELQGVGQALEATFILPPQSYTAHLFATGVTDAIVNEGQPDEYIFKYYRQGISRLHFEVVNAPPIEQTAEIIASIERAALAGELTGTGPAQSAKQRLVAFENMLKRASDLIAIGDLAGACVQLADAYQKTDGSAKPPDLVTGQAAADLARKISILIDDLGCSQ